MRESRSLCMVAGLLAGVPAAIASPGDIDLDQDSWWTLLTYRCTPHMMVSFCISDPFLLTTNDPIGLGRCCGQTGNFTLGNSHEITVKMARAIPYCGDMDLSYKFTWREDSNASFNAPPCGCVEMTLEQLSAVYVKDTVEQACEPDFGNAIGDPFSVRRRIRRVITTRTVPYYYQKTPVPCQGCPAGSAESDPNHATPIGTFPATIPRALPAPSRLVRPWDPATDGPPPGPDGTYPTMGPPNPMMNSVEIDLSEQFKARKIQSTLDLTLFETRTIVRELESAIASMPLVISRDSQCRVQLGDGLELKGQIDSLVSQLRKSAKSMIADKSYGDFNHSGSRDGSDYDALMERIFTPGELSEARHFDLNGDGVVNTADAIVYSQLP